MIIFFEFLSHKARLLFISNENKCPHSAQPFHIRWIGDILVFLCSMSPEVKIVKWKCCATKRIQFHSCDVILIQQLRLLDGIATFWYFVAIVASVNVCYFFNFFLIFFSSHLRAQCFTSVAKQFVFQIFLMLLLILRNF